MNNRELNFIKTKGRIEQRARIAELKGQIKLLANELLKETIQSLGCDTYPFCVEWDNSKASLLVNRNYYPDEDIRADFWEFLSDINTCGGRMDDSDLCYLVRCTRQSQRERDWKLDLIEDISIKISSISCGCQEEGPASQLPGHCDKCGWSLTADKITEIDGKTGMAEGHCINCKTTFNWPVMMNTEDKMSTKMNFN